MKWILIGTILLSACSFKSKEEELYGVVNGRTIRAKDIQSRLKKSIKTLETTSIDEKRELFEQVASEMVIEDEQRRTKFSQSRLMEFFDFSSQVQVSHEERKRYLSEFPELKLKSQEEADRFIKAERRARLEAKYRQELRNRSLIKFLWGDEKEAKARGLE